MKFPLLAIILFLSLTAYCQQTADQAKGARFQYVLLNDTSGRTLWPGGIEQQVRAAAQFLKQVVTPGSDIGSLVNFSQEFYLDVQNSTDPDAIVAKLVHQGRHGTALYEAVVAAAKWLATQQSTDTRKMIFVFTDGDDNASQMSLQSTIAAIQKMQIPVSIVAPSAVEHKRQGKAIKQLANASGGYTYFVPDRDSLDFSAFKRELNR